MLKVTKAQTIALARKYAGKTGLYQPSYWPFRTGNSCMAFLSFIWGLRKPSALTGSLISIAQFRAKYKWPEHDGASAQPGDMALWYFGSSTPQHTGLVISVTKTTVTTVEANTNKVVGDDNSPLGTWVKTRPLSELIKVVRPVYKDVKTVAATPTAVSVSTTVETDQPILVKDAGGPEIYLLVHLDSVTYHAIKALSKFVTLPKGTLTK